MILDCTQKQNAAFVKQLAAKYEDAVFPLREALERGAPCSVFSANAYILVADFKTVFSRTFLRRFKACKLGGSRMLYCVFVCSSPRGAGNSLLFSQTRMYGRLAEHILRSSGLVLFGCDCLCGAPDGAALARIAAYAHSALPFDWVESSYPRRAAAAHTKS